LHEADIILIGVSRSGKTPTSLYLAMQHGLKVANYPLIPEDFERDCLPSSLLPYQTKLLALSIEADRLASIRSQRRPGSTYASFSNCLQEVQACQILCKRYGIISITTTNRSIEEIATCILQSI
jgi:regulator of PEP synthase PpsR (kinase-PPPase family)